MFYEKYSPLISPLVIALDVVYGGNSVEPSNGEDHVVDDFDGEVATRVVHVGDWTPSVRCRVIHLTAAHSRDTVETANHVDLCRKKHIKVAFAFTTTEYRTICIYLCQ